MTSAVHAIAKTANKYFIPAKDYSWCGGFFRAKARAACQGRQRNQMKFGSIHCRKPRKNGAGWTEWSCYDCVTPAMKKAELALGRNDAVVAGLAATTRDEVSLPPKTQRHRSGLDKDHAGWIKCE
jgi:hypothetical protein